MADCAMYDLPVVFGRLIGDHHAGQLLIEPFLHTVDNLMLVGFLGQR